jgi:hypothetical protein
MSVFDNYDTVCDGRGQAPAIQFGRPGEGDHPVCHRQIGLPEAG